MGVWGALAGRGERGRGGETGRRFDEHELELLTGLQRMHIYTPL